jgi:hypothetical protein
LVTTETGLDGRIDAESQYDSRRNDDYIDRRAGYSHDATSEIRTPVAELGTFARIAARTGGLRPHDGAMRTHYRGCGRDPGSGRRRRGIDDAADFTNDTAIRTNRPGLDADTEAA